MKKFRSILIGGLSLVSLVCLTSCNLSNIKDRIISTINSNSKDDDSPLFPNNPGYDFLDPEYVELQEEDDGTAGYRIDQYDVKRSQDYVNVRSNGEQKILVIPCAFNDYPSTSMEKSEAEIINDIETLFFKEASDTIYWESVSSYYEKASYGNLKITGMVTSFFDIGKSVEEVASLTRYSDPTYYVLRKAIEWAKVQYGEETIKQFDNDKDGYIDGVWLIYSSKYYATNTVNSFIKTPSKSAQDILWAYTYWDYEYIPNVDSPVANCYAWGSYYFMYDGTSNGVDAHTFIHETGHMLGLEDYYDYDSTTLTRLSPTGSLDMMDNNIGDHCVFSKYLLGWVKPKLITSKGEYVLESFTETGQCLLIPSSEKNFSYSPYDEYLLIEFYTPTGLNDLDSKNKYCGSYPKMFSTEGIRIYHVDNRLAYVDMKNKKFYYTNIFDDSKVTNQTYYSNLSSNTSSRSIEDDIKLVTLLSATGKNNYYKNSSADNDDLFKNNSSLSEFTFNNKENLIFSINIEITGIFTKKATVTIS